MNNNNDMHCGKCDKRCCPSKPRLSQIIQGSKIDKLYYGKYLPLREKKLQEKIDEIRIIYDGINKENCSGPEKEEDPDELSLGSCCDCLQSDHSIEDEPNNSGIISLKIEKKINNSANTVSIRICSGDSGERVWRSISDKLLKTFKSVSKAAKRTQSEISSRIACIKNHANDNIAEPEPVQKNYSPKRQGIKFAEYPKSKQFKISVEGNQAKRDSLTCVKDKFKQHLEIGKKKCASAVKFLREQKLKSFCIRGNKPIKKKKKQRGLFIIIKQKIIKEPPTEYQKCSTLGEKITGKVPGKLLTKSRLILKKLATKVTTSTQNLNNMTKRKWNKLFRSKSEISTPENMTKIKWNKALKTKPKISAPDNMTKSKWNKVWRTKLKISTPENIDCRSCYVQCQLFTKRPDKADTKQNLHKMSTRKCMTVNKYLENKYRATYRANGIFTDRKQQTKPGNDKTELWSVETGTSQYIEPRQPKTNCKYKKTYAREIASQTSKKIKDKSSMYSRKDKHAVFLISGCDPKICPKHHKRKTKSHGSDSPKLKTAAILASTSKSSILTRRNNLKSYTQFPTKRRSGGNTDIKINEKKRNSKEADDLRSKVSQPQEKYRRRNGKHNKIEKYSRNRERLPLIQQTSSITNSKQASWSLISRKNRKIMFVPKKTQTSTGSVSKRNIITSVSPIIHNMHEYRPCIPAECKPCRYKTKIKVPSSDKKV